MFNFIPLLLYGLCFSCSIVYGLSFHPLALALLIALFLCDPKRLALTLLVSVGGFVVGYTSQSMPPPDKGPYSFTLQRIKESHKSHLLIGTVNPYNYRAIVKVKDLPDDISDELWIEGELTPFGIKAKSIVNVNDSNLAATRFELKKTVRNWINEHYPHKKAADLIGALITGDLDNRPLKKDFARFGLQHILAISGFHFSFLAMSLAFVLQRFFSFRTLPYLLIIILASYFLFLGPSSSIVRAWIAIAMTCTAQLIRRSSNPLNHLGLALIVVGVWDPQALLEAGTALSFGLTAAILLFAKPCDDWFKKWLYPRSYDSLISLNFFQQSGAIILQFIRKSLSLNAAVTFIGAPLTLAFFQTFPVFSLFFNLFFPTLIALSLFLFLFTWIPGVSYINSLYLDSILNLIHEPPDFLNINLATDNFKIEYAVIICSVAMLWGLYNKKNNIYNSFSI